MESDLKTILTGDGSVTLYHSVLNETYHSTHGAIQESAYVFITQGLEAKGTGKRLHVLEVGMGTGLNVLLTMEYATVHKVIIHYHTLEPNPLPDKILSSLNYESVINRDSVKGNLLRIHGAPWEREVALNEYFYLTKYQTILAEYRAEVLFDVVFYDAFAPSKQPEMWELSNFQQLFAGMGPEGILVSYCASGAFKRNLKQAGFAVQALPGPPGKKEMTRALKNNPS